MSLFKRLAVAFFLLFTFFVTIPSQAVNFACTVTDAFGEVTGRYHKGVDLGAPDGETPEQFEGTVIPCVRSGVVDGDQTGYGINPGGFGNMITVRCDDGISYTYGHVKAIYVEAGQRVDMGDPLGEVGNVGHSSGAHVHIQFFEGAPYASDVTDPEPFILACPYFQVNGDMSNNTMGSGIGAAIRKIIPSIDFDFSTYFVPSEFLETMMKEILEKIVPTFDFAENNLVTFLTVLMTLDFTWFMFPVLLNMTTRQNMSGLIVRMIRYSFWFALFMSWHMLVSQLFIPFVENMSSTFSGSEISQSSFLHFDELFVNISHIIVAFIHVDKSFSFTTAIFVCILVVAILVLTILATFYLMYKLVMFYLMCSMGVLGIPLYFLPSMEEYGKSFISGILASCFDLIVTAFIFVFISNEIGAMDPIPKDSVSSLVIFAFCWGALVFFIPSFTNRSIEAFKALWS